MTSIPPKNSEKNGSRRKVKSKQVDKNIVKTSPILFVPALVILIAAIILGNIGSSMAGKNSSASANEIGGVSTSKEVYSKGLILDLDFAGKSYSTKNPQKLYNLVDKSAIGTLGLDQTEQESDPNFDPNGYFTFNGQTQLITLDGKNAPKNDFTFEIWVRSAGNDEPAYPISTDASDYKKNTIGIKIKDNYWWIMGINDGGMVYIPFPDKTVDQSWHHVVATRNDKVLTIYVDGVAAEVTRDINKYNLSNDFITIGAVREGDKYKKFFKGDISQLRIYARALTNDEVLDNLKLTQPNFTKNNNQNIEAK